jgi:hypothetical protein
MPTRVEVTLFVTDGLLPALCDVDQNMLAVGVDPNLGYLWGAVRHEGGQLAVGRFAQQLLETGGYGYGHSLLLMASGRRGRITGAFITVSYPSPKTNFAESIFHALR